ncbi:MAG: hypothetical protein ABH879_02455 [archaeon]
MGDDWDKARVDRLKKEILQLRYFTHIDKQAESDEGRYVLEMVNLISHVTDNEDIQELLQIKDSMLERLRQMQVILKEVSRVISQQILISEEERKIRKINLKWQRRWMDVDKELSVITEVTVEIPSGLPERESRFRRLLYRIAAD